ncbi:MAG: SRPBCC domain-containing protein [candidate division Zixibacteria bacterium]|nr:SRPBCC domain-containing protein [candidate division Zixibacteria bacterium]MCI0596217.1 SRPBCC domain-containing protein [candidate division Zixibacteria bacterium]
MNLKPNVNVSVARRFAASPERVFDAWLNPEKARRFLFATESGQMTRVEIDARGGGSFAFVDRRDGEDIEHTGKYLEIDRPQLLVFTLSVGKYSPREGRVIIEISPVVGGCELALTHVGVFAEYAKRTEAGWAGILEALAATLGESSVSTVGAPAEKKEESQ